MPFPAQTPRPFTRENVLELKENQNGCYGLFRANTWIYVGRGDIRDRLLDHLNGDNGCITRSAPTHYVAAVTSNDEALEKELILALQPTCNQKVG